MSKTDARSAIGLLRAIRLIERVDQQQLLAPDAEPQQQPLAPDAEQQQPLAPDASLRHDLETFMAKYGGRPAATSKLGIRVARAGNAVDNLLEGYPTLTSKTEKRASKFLAALSKGQSLTPFNAWSKYMRLRVNLKKSRLSDALFANVSEQGRPIKRLLNAKRSQTPELRRRSQYEQEVASKGGLAVVQGRGSESSSQAAVGAHPAAYRRQAMLRQGEEIWGQGGMPGMPYTPQFVVDWLYQCVLDTVRVLEAILGVVSYSAEGYPLGDGAGQVMLFWGSHLGSIREQALIAWDYDVDLAVLYHENDFALIWNSAKRQLQHLGYVCTQHSAHKYRVAPKNPATWHPYQELYQETREKKPSLSRAVLSQLVASRWRHGARAQQPHGSNCIDIETYRIRPKVDVKLLGSQPIHTRLAHIFPTAVGVFGPLQFAIPNSPAMLLANMESSVCSNECSRSRSIAALFGRKRLQMFGGQLGQQQHWNMPKSI